MVIRFETFVDFMMATGTNKVDIARSAADPKRAGFDFYQDLRGAIRDDGGLEWKESEARGDARKVKLYPRLIEGYQDVVAKEAKFGIRPMTPLLRSRALRLGDIEVDASFDVTFGAIDYRLYFNGEAMSRTRTELAFALLSMAAPGRVVGIIDVKRKRIRSSSFIEPDAFPRLGLRAASARSQPTALALARTVIHAEAAAFAIMARG